MKNVRYVSDCVKRVQQKFEGLKKTVELVRAREMIKRKPSTSPFQERWVSETATDVRRILQNSMTENPIKSQQLR